MSLISTVKELIRIYKDEQTKLNNSIQLYRDILNNLTCQSFEESELAEDALPDADSSSREQEDMELLEKALEEALRVRTGTDISRKTLKSTVSHIEKEKGTTMGNLNQCLPTKGSQKAATVTSKSLSFDKEGHKISASTVRPKTSSRLTASGKSGKSKSSSKRTVIQNPPFLVQTDHRHASRKLQQPVSASAAPDQITTLLSENKTARRNMQSGDDPSNAASASKLSPLFSNTDKCGSPQNRFVPEQATKWRAYQSKQIRLWEKAIALQNEPVPERNHFLDHIRTTFPKDWPCGSPDQTRVHLDRLTHKALDLVHYHQAEKIFASTSSEMDAKLGGKHNENDSYQSRERLDVTTAELQILADEVKQEWKAWDQWRPEGGCLCPTGANDVWRDGISSPLPLIITCKTEAELQEVERLRASVALLQQEIHLEQVLLDSLSSHFSSITPVSGCLKASMLRDMYSLLGEGGERFPAIVLDSEPD
ncbi:hypothetical protein OJAV_G00078830 [Oryzias javanicus]|uniref:Tubulin epsilon and delta complex protein 2 n=1 Tax=Oryzias javanicus TaxID=123683 RepID=A0A437D340_ORYJA|nr:hypothetical protein OJAV_G00078830 [Oryzias javanicus]